MDEATQKRLELFLTKRIYPKDLARQLRRFKYETIKLVLSSEDSSYNKDHIAEGHYFLTELCEILDPQLEDEKK